MEEITMSNFYYVLIKLGKKSNKKVINKMCLENGGVLCSEKAYTLVYKFREIKNGMSFIAEIRHNKSAAIVSCMGKTTRFEEIVEVKPLKASKKAG